jgi:L-ribulokinase
VNGDGSPTAQDLVVGIDFGTLSGRAVVVRVSDGEELGTAVHEYAHGVIDQQLPGSDLVLAPDWALQDPNDYREVLRHAVPDAVRDAGVDPSSVIAVGIDFTACTVMPTLRDGTPLCELAGLSGRPHAWPKLWRHHAAQPQADRINRLAEQRGEAWLPRYGGRISSEWEFAKGLQVLDEDPEMYARTDRWIEAADWIVWQLTGVETRNVCTAGYKGIWQDGHRPSRDFLAALDERFVSFVDDKIEHPLSELASSAGELCAQAAEWTGLRQGITVAVANVDAHVTAPAANAVQSGDLVAVMGTSTCHVMNSDVLAEIPGMCGVVRGGITPDFWGYEAGQSAVGDIFSWYIAAQVPGTYRDAAQRQGVGLHEYLSDLAGQQEVGAHGLLALDWHGGNRSLLVDHDLSGVLLGATLATRPEEVYRALVEATAFGTRMIVDAFEAAGVAVNRFVAAGGLIKNAFLMQVYADVMDRPIAIIDSAQGPALGSAIHAAVAVGAYANVSSAAATMGRRIDDAFLPDPRRAAAYRVLFEEYRTLHDWFGRGGNDVLHRLHEIRNRARAAVAPNATTERSDFEDAHR